MRIHPFAISLCILLTVASGAKGQDTDWAKEIFGASSYDFGVVARGAKVEHKFPFENKWEEPLIITSLTSSCGCTKPKLDKTNLKTWEKGELTVAIDTRSFLGRKDATINIRLAPPFPSEVQIHTHTYIRSDVVVQPGVVQFGPVGQGVAMKQKVTVSYAGRSDWQIQRVESDSPYLEGRVSEVSRGNGQVKYDLWVTLKADAPVGYIKDQLVLVTNDFSRNSSRVPVAVEGVVSAALSVRPSPLFLGVIETGQSVTRPLVIQGKTPFHILAARSSNPHFQCKPPQEAKTVQLLPVTFDAKDVSGRVSGTIFIQTDYPQAGNLQVEANVQVTPRTVSGK
jgi:hypothetical protein